MAGLIRRSDIDEVRSRTNLADIVGDYVTLKGAGSGSMKGLCPFHEERSPSFHVRPQVGFYHCFGCGEGGDVFTFLQKMDHVTFSEAVERMAGKLGYELHYEDGGQASDHGNRARLLAANQGASEFFVAQLATLEAEPARIFLGARGFDQSAAERFGVGFAPKSYDALSNHLKALGYTEQELLEAGLVGQGDRGTYDRFRGRLVWPIRDTTGQTLGFGARKLLDDDQGPKYLNTPETAVYHKSQVLYGLDLAKKDIARCRQVVVVEGYTDVMACHLAGITTAVATCGTSFGVDHIKMIRRVMGDVDNRDSTGTGEVIFTFDPDEAGQKAAGRAFAEEQRFAAQTFVAVAPDGLDPCDLRLNRGDDAIRRLISTRKPMFEFMIRRMLTAHNLDTVEGRVAALRAAAPVVAGIRDQSMSSGYVRNLAGWLGIDPAEVSRAVSTAKAEGSRATSARARAGAGSSADAYGARGSGSSFDGRPSAGNTAGNTAGRIAGSIAGGSDDSNLRDQAGVPAVVVALAPSLMDLPTDSATRLERDALMAILQRPADVGADFISRATRVAFIDNTLAVVRDGIATSLEHIDAPDWLQRVADEVPAMFATLVKQLGVAPIPQREELLASYCHGVVSALIERELLRKKRDLMGALQRLDSAADPTRYAELQRELMATEAERRTLREG